MKLLVLVGLLGLTLASLPSFERRDINEVEFRSEREYRYLFDGHLSTALPVSESQKAITRIQSLVSIQPESSEYWFRMQLRNLRWATSQEEVDTLRMLPFESMEEVTLEKEQERLLSLPIRFNYKHGLVGDVEFDGEELAWSKNIKKSIVNMLQINYVKKGVEMRDHMTEEEDIHKNDYFTVVERTLEGECEVAYTRIEESKEFEQWTKSVNFDKCNIRPEVRYGRRFVEKCEECEKTVADEKLSSTVMTFNLTHGRTENKFLIRDVELRSQHLFAPIADKNQLLVSYVYNKLSLVYAGEVEKTIEKIQVEEKETLIYNSEMEIAEEMFAMTGEEKYLRHIPMWSNKVEMVKQIFNKIVKDLESGVELETTHLIARVVKVLRFCTEHEIEKIERFLYDMEKMEEKTVEKMRHIFFDSLALSGTKVTIRHLLEKMTKKQMNPIKASQLFKMLAEIRVPSEYIAEDVYRFCESDVAHRNPVLRQSCWLTYGSIVSGFCGDNEEKMAYELKEKLCTRSLKQKIVDQLIRKFKSAETRYEKVLMIKTLSNAAIDVSVYSLNTIIADKMEEKTVRLQAIEALRRLRTVMPRKIQYVLMPVYKDRMELPEIRMSALNIILMTRPEEAILSQVVEQVIVERSRQVRVFTYNLLSTLTKSTNPCEKVLALRVSKALRLIPTELKQNLLDSRFNKWTLYNTEYMTGATFNWASIFSSESVLPKEIMASLDSVFGGEWNKYLAQIGLYQNNMDVILNKMIRKVEQSGLETLVVRGKRSATFRPVEILRTIAEKLNIKRREMSNDEPEALLYFRYKDMDYAFLPIDMETIPELFKKIAREGRIELGDIERVLSHGFHYTLSGAVFVHETIRKIPTALGMPIVLGSKMPTLATVTGHIKVEFEPKSSDRFNGLRLHLVAKPEVASTHVIKLEARTPVVYSGVKLLHGAKINTPIDLQMFVNWEDKLTLKTVFKVPETKRHIVHLMTRPVTYVAVWDKETRHYPETIEKTIYLKDSRYPVETIEREYFEKTGMKVLVSGSIRRPFFPLYATEEHKTVLIGDNLINIWYEPMTEKVREIVFHMEMDVFEPVKRMESPTFENFYEKKSMNKRYETEEEDFEVEMTDYKTETESERRNVFAKYVKNLEIVKAYKHRLSFKLETVGDIKNKLETEVRAICDDKIRYCRVHFEARRTPFGEESREWELKALIQTLYPEMPMTFKQMFDQMHREFIGNMEIQWGSEEKYTMNLKLQGQQSRDQKIWMKKVEREQNGLTETEKLIEAAKLNQYKLVAEHKISPMHKMYLRNFLSLLKSWNFMNTQVEFTNKMYEGRMEAKLTIEPISRRFCDIVIETPEQRVLFRNIVVPFELPTLNIRRHYGSINSMKHIAEKIEKETRAECVVKSNEIKTFDNLFYRLPMVPCQTVLAKDCSSEIPKFTVLMEKVAKNTEEKILTIHHEKNSIELELKREKMIVKVNGEIIKSEEELENFGIFIITEKLYKIDLEDVLVTFDGIHAKIQLSALYKNKQCGICGHYDNEETNEFRRADNIETTDLMEFHKSFLHKNQRCEMDEYELNKESNYKILREETSSSEEELMNEYEEPELRTRVLERGHRMCFSEMPVKSCRTEKKEFETTYKQMTFRCLRKSLPVVEKMMRELRKEKVLTTDMLEEIEETYEHKIRVPKMCLAY